MLREVQTRTAVVNTPRMNCRRYYRRSVSKGVLANLPRKNAEGIELISNNDW